MQQNGNSRFLFLFDLSIIYICFFSVYIYYEGFTSIPLKGNILMVAVAFLWFIISVNSDVCRVNRQSRSVKTVEKVLVAYSILSVAVIAVVAHRRCAYRRNCGYFINEFGCERFECSVGRIFCNDVGCCYAAKEGHDK